MNVYFVYKVLTNRIRALIIAAGYIRFCTLCFSSSFLFNVVISRHFNTVKTLDILESGYSRTDACP